MMNCEKRTRMQSNREHEKVKRELQTITEDDFESPSDNESDPEEEMVLPKLPRRPRMAVTIEEDEKELSDDEDKLVPSNLVDKTKINKDYNYNNIYIYKHKMDESVDLSSLKPTTTESFDQFGGSINKTFYSISRVPRGTNIKQIEKVTKKIGSELSRLLPGYRYFIASNKVEVYNKEIGRAHV